MNYNKALLENDLKRKLDTKKLENIQKIDNFGPDEWPSKCELGSDETEEKSYLDDDKDDEISELSEEKLSSETILDGVKVAEGVTPTVVKSHCWVLDPAEYACTQPGCIGFNGHQAVFHCYKPGKPYLSRGGTTDSCLIKLTDLNDGGQACTLVYDKPPPPPPLPRRIICTTERGTNVSLEDFCKDRTLMECKTTETESLKDKKSKESIKSKKGKKKGKGGKTGGKKKKKK